MRDAGLHPALHVAQQSILAPGARQRRPAPPHQSLRHLPRLRQEDPAEPVAPQQRRRHRLVAGKLPGVHLPILSPPPHPPPPSPLQKLKIPIRIAPSAQLRLESELNPLPARANTTRVLICLCFNFKARSKENKFQKEKGKENCFVARDQMISM